jgi:maleylacetoacetate isomerase
MPALEVEGVVIAQSGAILAYLEERWPRPALLPDDLLLRARARSFAQHITAEMHAITVNRVRRYLTDDLEVDERGMQGWVAHWMAQGFQALEQALADRPPDWRFCFGDTPGWADLHLIPQLRTARRLDCDVSPYARLLAVETACADLPAFVRARPENQPDFRG